MSDTNDECGQPNRYQSLIRHLANERFLENNSKDVQIWLACCLADILRVFAPNVPLGDPSQLKVSAAKLSRSMLSLFMSSASEGSNIYCEGFERSRVSEQPAVSALFLSA